MEARKSLLARAGRRTGVRIKRNVRRDHDGFENVDDFFDSESEARFSLSFASSSAAAAPPRALSLSMMDPPEYDGAYDDAADDGPLAPPAPPDSTPRRERDLPASLRSPAFTVTPGGPQIVATPAGTVAAATPRTPRQSVGRNSSRPHTEDRTGAASPATRKRPRGDGLAQPRKRLQQQLATEAGMPSPVFLTRRLKSQSLSAKLAMIQRVRGGKVTAPLPGDDGDDPAVQDDLDPMIEVKDPNRPKSTVLMELASVPAIMETKTGKNGITQGSALSAETFECGTLVLPPGAKTPTGKTESSTELFSVVAGRCKVTIHKTTLQLGAGAFFFVPPRNSYRITADKSGECRLNWTVVY